MADSHRLALLCGGGPAPGINSVIGAATIRATLAGTSVIGIRDGFKWLMQGDTDHAQPLTIEAVSRIHFTGGSDLGLSRAQPPKDPRPLQATPTALGQMGVARTIRFRRDAAAQSGTR